MPSIGSWVRFAVGIVLSVEVLHQWLVGNSMSMLANGLAAAFLALSVLYFVFRF